MLKTIPLGRNCGLQVSQLCLGTMNFGQPGRGHQGDWTIGLDDARPLFKAAIDRGLFYFDCADQYGLGASEKVVGALLRELLPRDQFVLATKIAMPMGKGANQGGLSRKHVIEAVNASLERLGVDYVDQLVIHRHPHGVPGYSDVPIEETLSALDEVVRAGKVLYLGGSSMFAWQFAEMQLTAKMNGWTQFVSMQNHYNLVYREEEREMNPYCIKTGVALMPWSPLARGILTGSYRGGFDGGSTARSQGRDRVRTEGLYRGEAVFSIADRVIEVAARHGKSPAQIALAWLLGKPGITAPVVGVSKLAQLDELVAATQITLEPQDVAYLEALYRPVENLLSIGHS
ncbi:MAG: aldo/keto reductase [Burkholderiaceae bacterium]|nr:aldo/keto reductase [Burkholderiaceae bacterium]MBP6816012.1 aldo/keto reductase [Burkholderiaceae bacterium]